MKKFLILFLSISIPSMAQTATNISTQLSQAELEQQSLINQNNTYDTKILQKQKEIEEARKKLSQLQTQRALSEDACKSISESDLNLMMGLSAGTIAMSGVETAIGTTVIVKSATSAKNNSKSNKDNKDNNKEEETENPNSQDQTSQPETPTIQKAGTGTKIYNIGNTVLSAGSTITSAVALSKVNGLKNDIEKCIDSFK